MRDYIDIGPVPAGEECQQVGTDRYDPILARKECHAFKSQLERQFPNGRFVVKSHPHDFGSYHSVAAIFDDSNEDEVNAAYDAENNMPEFWDDKAKLELGLMKYIG